MVRSKIISILVPLICFVFYTGYAQKDDYNEKFIKSTIPNIRLSVERVLIEKVTNSEISLYVYSPKETYQLSTNGIDLTKIREGDICTAYCDWRSPNVIQYIYKESEKEQLTMDEKLQLMKIMGVIQGDESGNLELNKKISRAELAAVLSRFASLDAPKSISNFEDIKGHWAENPINVLFSYKILKGETENLFNPDDDIIYVDFYTMLIRVAGLEEYALHLEGYPNGYITLAKQYGLYVDQDLKNSPTRGEAFDIIFDTIDNSYNEWIGGKEQND